MLVGILGDSMKWSDLTEEQKERILKFAQGSTRDDLYLYREHARTPEKFEREEPRVKPKAYLLDYLDKFKDKFVK